MKSKNLIIPCSIFLISMILAFSLKEFSYAANKNTNIKNTIGKTVTKTDSENLSNKSKENSEISGKKDKSFKEESKKETVHTLWKLFKKGGPFMWPILAFAALGLAFIIERFIFYARARLSSKEFIDKLHRTILTGTLSDVEKLCSKKNNKAAKILQKGLNLKELGYERVEKTLSVAASIEVAALERGLNVLSALGNIVPMLGFLGTVSGMINAFSEIAKADQVKASLVAGGIQEALLTTAAGLMVAIPTLAFYNYFIHKIDGFIADVEKISTDIVEKLVKSNDAENKDKFNRIQLNEN